MFSGVSMAPPIEVFQLGRDFQVNSQILLEDNKKYQNFLLFDKTSSLIFWIMGRIRSFESSCAFTYTF